MSYESPNLLASACPAPIRHREQIVLGHGSGGRLTTELIEGLILPAFDNPALSSLDDQAKLTIGQERIAFTTDSFVVTPIFFPDSDIAELAVNGTVNDLAMGGARPLALSLAFIIEEGFPIADLALLIESARAAAARVGVPIVTGDTKVVGKGACDRIFINTAGIGAVPAGLELGSERVQPGDVILVSGTIGDHGIAVMSKRESLGLDGELASDTAPLYELMRVMLTAAPNTHAMRDPTRGGLGAVLVEFATRRRLGLEVSERQVPVAETVRGACELLGLDPMLVACEGRLVAFVPEAEADAALVALRTHPLGENAAIIGRVSSSHPGAVWVDTAIGGRRSLELPFSEPLPRIC